MPAGAGVAAPTAASMLLGGMRKVPKIRNRLLEPPRVGRDIFFPIVCRRRPVFEIDLRSRGLRENTPQDGAGVDLPFAKRRAAHREADVRAGNPVVLQV